MGGVDAEKKNKKKNTVSDCYVNLLVTIRTWQSEETTEEMIKLEKARGGNGFS